MTIHKWQMIILRVRALAGLAVATIRPDLRISNGGKYVTAFMNTSTKSYEGGSWGGAHGLPNRPENEALISLNTKPWQHWIRESPNENFQLSQPGILKK